MKKDIWNEAFNSLDSELIAKYMSEKESAVKRQRRKRIFLRTLPFAACFCLIVSLLVAVPMMLNNDAEKYIHNGSQSESQLPQGSSVSSQITDGGATDSSSDTAGSSGSTTNSSGSSNGTTDSSNGTTDSSNGITDSSSNATDSSSNSTESSADRPDIPIVNVQAPSSAPKYEGEEYSIGAPSSSGSADMNPTGISVTAQFIEMHSDTYTFFDDWRQYEYCILKMRTVKLLKGTEMTEEFYYLVPVAYVTDFSLFDSFVIRDMAQFGYDYSIMYNKTQGVAEQLYLPLFGYRVYGYHLMGENFIAYDADGNFDARLWNANEAWIEDTDRASIIDTIAQAEAKIQQENNSYLYVHLLNDISGEAAKVLEAIKSFENGMFVPAFSSNKLFLSPEVQFHAVKYINGFATNETVSVRDKDWTGGEEDTYAFSTARFDEEDMGRLPDLHSAFESVKEALNSGLITPPHFNNQEKLRRTTTGVFGWYAKTENGVVGIVRVTWRFYSEEYIDYYDDAYYIIEYGSDTCKSIDRDALRELFGDYETRYIYDGEYNEYGKIFSRDGTV